MPNTAAATRTNHRDAGRPTEGYWFGRGKAPSGGQLVTIERHGRGLTVRDQAGEVLDSFGDTAKFWLAPADAPAPAGETAEQAERDAAHIEAAHEHFMARQIRDYRGSATAAAAARAARPIAVTLHAAALESTLAHAAAVARAAGRRLLAAALDTRQAAAAAELAAARYAEAVDSATRTTVEAPPAPAAEAPAPVVIVPCGAQKRAGLVPAGEKYTGPYAASCRAAGEAIAARTGARVLILSALYGLLELGDPVADYDLAMGDPGSVTAGRVAEQAAALGITDAAVYVLGGKKYADTVSAVWPHAVRVLDGCTSYGNQRARCSAIVRGEWSPAAAVAAPALLGAEHVAPPAVADPVAGAALVRGDLLAPGAFNLTSPEPVLVTASAVPADEVCGTRRYAFAFRVGCGPSVHAVVFGDAQLVRVGKVPVPREVASAPQEYPLPPVAEATPVGPVPAAAAEQPPAPVDSDRGAVSGDLRRPGAGAGRVGEAEVAAVGPGCVPPGDAGVPGGVGVLDDVGDPVGAQGAGLGRRPLPDHADLGDERAPAGAGGQLVQQLEERDRGRVVRRRRRPVVHAGRVAVHRGEVAHPGPPRERVVVALDDAARRVGLGGQPGQRLDAHVPDAVAVAVLPDGLVREAVAAAPLAGRDAGLDHVALALVEPAQQQREAVRLGAVAVAVRVVRAHVRQQRCLVQQPGRHGVQLGVEHGDHAGVAGPVLPAVEVRHRRRQLPVARRPGQDARARGRERAAERRPLGAGAEQVEVVVLDGRPDGQRPGPHLDGRRLGDRGLGCGDVHDDPGAVPVAGRPVDRGDARGVRHGGASRLVLPRARAGARKV
jgi:hypothetical protein